MKSSSESESLSEADVISDSRRLQRHLPRVSVAQGVEEAEPETGVNIFKIIYFTKTVLADFKGKISLLTRRGRGLSGSRCSTYDNDDDSNNDNDSCTTRSELPGSGRHPRGPTS